MERHYEVVKSFQKGISLKMENRNGTSLWEDMWCGSLLLMTSFPDIYMVVANKYAKVSDYLVKDQGMLWWHFILIRVLNDWESLLYQTFGTDWKDAICSQM